MSNKLKIRNHVSIHATALDIRKRWGSPTLTARELFEMACGMHGVRRQYALPKLP